jgi:hypothetical protein
MAAASSCIATTSTRTSKEALLEHQLQEREEVMAAKMEKTRTPGVHKRGSRYVFAYRVDGR